MLLRGLLPQLCQLQASRATELFRWPSRRTSGNSPLDSVGNLALRNLGATMVKGGLGASAIRSYSNAAKMVVASAIDEEGDARYPRKWNHDFIDLPEDKNPKRPAVTADVVTAIVGAPTKKLYRMFYTLCASAGLRFGEALGIDIKNIPRTSPRSISVRKLGADRFTIT
jgi:integrase